MREIVLDTETTGLNFKNGDRIIEVGCIELINHIPSGKDLQFYCYVNKKIDEGATKVHGITNDFLNSHPTFEENVDLLLDFIKEDTLIIHNADFDLGFINNEMNIIGRTKIKNKITDTLALARKNLNTRIANLDYLCRRFSIDLSNRSLHGALLDSQLLAEVYLELIGGKQISMNLNEVNKENQNNLKKRILKPNLIEKVLVNKEDVKKHQEMLKMIKNPLWEKLHY